MSEHRTRPWAARAAWAAVTPLAGIASARVAGYDDHPLFSVANAATPMVYLPAYGALALGALTGRRVLTATAGLVAAAHLAWTAPEMRRARPVPPEAAQGKRLRIVTANIRFTNPDSTLLGQELAALDADVLLVQELVPHHVIMLKAAGAFEQFPYSFLDPRPKSFGSGTWSKFPLTDGETWELAGLPALPTSRVTVHLDGSRRGGPSVSVYNVHTKAPTRRYWIPRWKAQFRALQSRVQNDRYPVIVAGDCNATYGHKPFRDLLGAGLANVHVLAGRGWATTWPRRPVSFPLWRLDHVLVSGHFAVLGVAEGRGEGSDHRPVIADLALLP